MTAKPSVAKRIIISEFASEIKRHRIPTKLDDEIFFRDDKDSNKRRPVYKVPVELLRFRKDNGRIASDVATYETSKGQLNEATDFGQSVLRGFLARKDPQTTVKLKNSITKSGQLENAVITADGFLINGNRRKLVLESLLEEKPGKESYRYLKVVILPGISENEPPPTLKELEQIENRYQLHQLGKAEYYNFDKAISIKRKIEIGMSLDEQLRDDPNYVELNDQDFKKALRKFEDEFLEPLNCVDRYLKFYDRVGHYNTVSEGRTDSRGRWQAFLDYYKSVYRKTRDAEQRKKLQLRENEIRDVEDIAFKIIRKREIAGVNKKIHQIMRDLPKLLANPRAKKVLLGLTGKKAFLLSKEEIIDEQGHPLDEKTKDKVWGDKFGDTVSSSVQKAYSIVETKKVQDTPLQLLEGALGKLNHNHMHLDLIKPNRVKEALKLVRNIGIRARELERKLSMLQKRRQKS